MDPPQNNAGAKSLKNGWLAVRAKGFLLTQQDDLELFQIWLPPSPAKGL
jgi:hypothetical protein